MRHSDRHPMGVNEPIVVASILWTKEMIFEQLRSENVKSAEQITDGDARWWVAGEHTASCDAICNDFNYGQEHYCNEMEKLNRKLVRRIQKRKNTNA